MATRKTRAPAFTWDSVPLADQRKTLDAFANDGHSVYSVEGLLADGVITQGIADAFSRKQTSDGTYKGTTFSNETGAPIEPVAVYGLTVLRSLAAHYGLRSGALGRGFEARDLTGQIDQALKEKGA